MPRSLKTTTLHPLIDQKFDKDLFFDYTAIHEALALDVTLKKLHEMANPPRLDPLIVSRRENCLSAEEIVSCNFVQKACENIANVNVILTIALRKAMADAGFSDGNELFLCVNGYLLPLY